MSNRPSFVPAVIVIVGIVACARSTAAGQDAIQSPTAAQDILSRATVTPHVGDRLPLDLVFTDHTGREQSLRTIVKDQAFIIDFVYFDCPMLCKLTTESLFKAARDLEHSVGKECCVLLISFNPHDNAAKAKAARESMLARFPTYGDGVGWHFLTGDESNIEAITKAAGFHYYWDDERQMYAHAASLLIGSPNGMITQYMDGVNYDSASLDHAVEGALAERETPSTSSAFVRCYLYDPTTGRFGLLVQWAIRLSGVLIVGAIVFGVIAMNRRSSLSRRATREATKPSGSSS